MKRKITDISMLKKRNNCLIIECPAQIRYKNLNPFTYAPVPPWQPQPPFWYKTHCDTEKYYGNLQKNINEYSFSKLPQPEKFLTIFEELQIECPERYLPGEIHKRKTPKEPVTMANMDCSKVWQPKTDVFYTEFDSQTLENRPLLEDDILEQAERSKNIFDKTLRNVVSECV
ncbi:uncharacterized protein LOC111055965 [Nilaparvata lugens]|uniref:uncharacterized protein LOC111055965 n=1 Tax=Nilaparvata lugens TaxID=108931 RepID=UPI00193DC79A|nr:uncharacterized protein LOC111055965 [Nilaparvata lugens]